MVKVHRIHVVIVLASYEFYSSVRYDSEGKERESWNLGPFFIYIFSIFVKNGHHTSCEDTYIFLTYNNLMILIFLLILQHLWQFNLDEIVTVTHSTSDSGIWKMEIIIPSVCSTTIGLKKKGVIIHGTANITTMKWETMHSTFLQFGGPNVMIVLENSWLWIIWFPVSNFLRFNIRLWITKEVPCDDFMVDQSNWKLVNHVPLASRLKSLIIPSDSDPYPGNTCSFIN